ncbi:MAG: recombinase family protein [Planctomycetes bacterium]|nr:recombinase family protein [Planctomycetota bacterium]
MAKRQLNRASSPTKASPATKPIAIGYARCSTGHQEHSVSDQRQAFARWAGEHGYTLAHVFQDEGVSGGRLSRPGLDAMLARLESEQATGVVLLWDVSRTARPDDPLDGVLLERRITSTGWRLIYINGAQRTGDAFTDSLTALVDFKTSGDYRRSIAINGTRGLARARAQGKLSGPVPFGYARAVRWTANAEAQIIARTTKQATANAASVRLVPGDPIEVATVRRIFDDYTAKSMGTEAIARALESDSVPAPSGGRWNASSVLVILTNPAYAGDSAWNRTTRGNVAQLVAGKPEAVKAKGKRKHAKSEHIIVKDAHEPLVSRETFDQTQAIMASRARETGRARSAERYPLSGILRCGACGGPMAMRSFTRENGKRTERYVCRGPVTCGEAKIPAAAIELAVGAALNDALGAYVASPELRAVLVAKLGKAMGDVQSAATTDAEARELEKRITRAVRALTVVDDLETVATLNADIKTMRAKLARLQEERQAQPETSPQSVADEIIGILADLPRLHQLDQAQRRAFYTRAVAEVRLEGPDVGSVTIPAPLAALVDGGDEGGDTAGSSPR